MLICIAAEACHSSYRRGRCAHANWRQSVDEVSGRAAALPDIGATIVFLAKEDFASLIDEQCIALFDDLCEQRSNVALAYLLSSWPLYDYSIRTRSKLHATLTQMERATDTELTNQNRTTLSRLTFLLSMAPHC
ncbi:hypothetical protein EOS_35500 [Caballeronia mineralivorans PML1(12)]|uniref:Uncharacterized protein n=1 Tax=Caballeronia mineralivorans PML1(12) TaxID=908627 RepID=A0A0J1FP07_9BURK|nr:hypothetical protein EOS_35500 [Caballeronia mineralivorans PML1(12)]